MPLVVITLDIGVKIFWDLWRLRFATVSLFSFSVVLVDGVTEIRQSIFSLDYWIIVTDDDDDDDDEDD